MTIEQCAASTHLGHHDTRPAAGLLLKVLDGGDGALDLVVFTKLALVRTAHNTARRNVTAKDLPRNEDCALVERASKTLTTQEGVRTDSRAAEISPTVQRARAA